MASCDHPEERDDPLRVVDDDSNASGDEVKTPNSQNKKKRKETDEGSGSKSAKKNRSLVWDHFTKKKGDNDIANCNYCGKEMASATNSGTSSLKNHLDFACKSYTLWQSANTFGKQGVMSADGEDGNLRVCKVSKAGFREASNEMMVLGELPLSWVDSLAWKYFCDKMKLYTPHSRRTATRDIVDMYVKKKEAMTKILGENKQRLSLTTDIWTSPYTGSSYMVITAHFIDAWWKLRKLIIGFKNVYDHKRATISKVLLDCLEEWDIKRVFCITVDNATANSSAMAKFKEGLRRLEMMPWF
ncbi:hypothetical protein N665_0162s0002 [Sinapis alba]|nr:hypothetical protein N665_0162s0002 [Sinapis alba]